MTMETLGKTYVAHDLQDNLSTQQHRFIVEYIMEGTVIHVFHFGREKRRRSCVSQRYSVTRRG